MAAIHIMKLASDTYRYWVIFRHGEIATPILLLDDAQMERLVADYEQEKKEK